MELISLFAASFIVGFSGALMPGPMLAIDIAESSAGGIRTGPIITTGHALAEIALVVLLSLGLATLVSNHKIVGNIIGMVGGGMLIFMGLGMIWKVFRLKAESLSDTRKNKKSTQLVLDGFVASISNPYWFIWWATTGLAFLIKALKYGPVGPAVFYIGHISSDFVWYTLVSFLIWRGRKIITGTAYKILIIVCAFFLLGIGGLFIRDGVVGSI
ncbi:MAG: LysE family transporter [candidate division Zixibacteria bacterium]|nr:LysE family transporter [candidate division Zixibacteria bacterium]